MAEQKTLGDMKLLTRVQYELLVTWHQITGQIPENVVYYRGGASQDQHFGVLQTEMNALRKAFRMLLADCPPLITFIAVNKRHHVHAFPTNSSDGNCENDVEPETIIDTGIVDAHGFDFYLYGHNSGHGTTSIPCHYTPA